MGLRFSDAVRLSWSNIAQYKKRSATLVLTIAVFFGALLAVLFAMYGLEDTIVQSSTEGTHGSAYLAVSYHALDVGGVIDGIDSIDELNYERISPEIKESDLAKIRERAARYGGEVVGYTWTWQIGYPYRVVSLSAVEDFVDKDLSLTPESQIPVLMPNGWTISEKEAGAAALFNPTLYRVGDVPMVQQGRPTLSGLNPLNIVLGQVRSNTLADTFFIVDDGSGRAGEYIIEQATACMEEYDGCFMLDEHPYKEVVVKFADPKQAVAFATPEDAVAGIPLYTNFPFVVTDLFGSVEETMSSIVMFQATMLPIMVLLFVVALIIATFTFAHLIDQDAATVALYRSMGASTGDIYLIYFLYLLELCVLAIFASIIIALLLVGVLWLLNHKALAERLQEFYYLSSVPQINLFGFNELSWVIVMMILCLAPLSLLFSLGHFSVRNIAKKLKED